MIELRRSVWGGANDAVAATTARLRNDLMALFLNLLITLALDEGMARLVRG